MTTADTDARRERVDFAMVAPVVIVATVAIVESAFANEIERPPDRVRRPPPSRKTGSDFRAAPETRPEARGVGRCGAPVERAIVELRRSCRARRPAKDSGSDNSRIKAAIKTRIPRFQCLVAMFGVELLSFHAPIMRNLAVRGSRFRTSLRLVVDLTRLPVSQWDQALSLIRSGGMTERLGVVHSPF